MAGKITQKAVNALSELFAVVDVAFFFCMVVVLGERCVVADHVMAFVDTATFVPCPVEGDKGADEIVDGGLLGVVVECDVGVVEQVCIEDALAVQHLQDVGLVLKI